MFLFPTRYRIASRRSAIKVFLFIGTFYQTDLLGDDGIGIDLSTGLEFIGVFHLANKRFLRNDRVFAGRAF